MRARMSGTTEARRDPLRPRGLRIGRFFGVELVADWSLAIIFFLIAVNLGAGLFPLWHPGWSAASHWLLAIAAALLFFASIALHELSHAIVARRYGIPVRRITLFVFGGMAQIEREPPTPRAEFFMAIVGPVTSIAIGLLSVLIGSALGSDAIAANPGDPAGMVRDLGPGATLFMWLGPVNLLIGVFNMIPGFPLDGGRVLRAGIWWTTGDLRKATRWASLIGQGVGWALMAIGVAMMFGLDVIGLGAGFLPGLWMLLIGWFLNNAARMSLHQLLLSEALADVSVRDVMRTRVQTVLPALTLGELVRDVWMGSDQHAFPVVVGDTILGLVRIDDIRRVPREHWDQVTVAEVMTPSDRLHLLRPDEPATEVVKQLADEDAIPVVDGHHLLGVARREDIMKWLALHAPAS
jgi:Zn-dependent protease/predicted transcriptional regulator